jgi:hypothetical protein
LGHVRSRIAASLVTGPLAFGVAGLIDLLGYALASLRARIRARRLERSRPATRLRVQLSTIWSNEGQE